MFDKTVPAAENLKLAIDKYGKDNLYKELPDYIKNLYKPESFYNKINRLHGYTFFTDSKLLYEILRLIGISYESLFNPESEESKIAFYLNKINDNIAALKDDQRLNNWFENNAFIQKSTPRTTLIIKLDSILSIWYMNLSLIPAYSKHFQILNIKEQLFKPDIQINIYPPNISKLDVSGWIQNIDNHNIASLFLTYYKTYSTKDRPKLNKLFTLVGINTTQFTATSLSLLGINYILINNIQNYFKACNETPFYEGTDDNKLGLETYQSLKSSLNIILKKFDEVIEFIEIRSKVSIYQDFTDLVSDSIEQLISIENLITNIFPAYIPIWKHYTEAIENKVLQQYENQAQEFQNNQNNQLLTIIKDLKKIDLRLKGSEENAISLLRFKMNEVLTSSPFGMQIVTPMTKLKYERYISETLESTKIRIPDKNFFTHFENRTIGYLERYKSYHLREG